MTEQQWEQLLNIQTSGDQACFPSEANYHRYEPTPYADLETLFANYTPLAHAHFLDYGCGKGRLNFFVGSHGYAATGIEMDRFFVQHAQANAVNFHKRYPQAQLAFICALAQEFRVQPDHNTFYFFNPFHVRIFQQVVKQLLHSLTTSPREAALILYYPSTDYTDFLSNCTPFQLSQTIPCHPTDYRHCFQVFTYQP